MKHNRIYVNAQREYLCFGSVDFDLGSDAPGVRGEVVDFSIQSRKRLQRAIRNAVAEYSVFGTLTYPPGYGGDGATVKRDLDVFIKRVRRIQVAEVDSLGIPFGSDGKCWSILWWQEWQKNGRIHFHFAGTHFMDREWLSQIWYEVVGSGNADHLAAGTNIKKLSGGRNGVAAYAAKYMSKTEQKRPPDDWHQVGRFWGIRGDRRTVEAATTLSPRQASYPEIDRCLNELICLIEEGVASGGLDELTVPDDDSYRHFRISDVFVGDRARRLIRHINFHRETYDMLAEDQCVDEHYIFNGTHTQMFHVERVSELHK